MSESQRHSSSAARRWLDDWATAGAALEAERLARLDRMSDDEARELTRAVLAVWRPSASDDFGVELVTQQRWFMRAARAGRRP
jgi:hypothetical protein